MIVELTYVAKTYAAPLSLKETPLTLAVNLSARFGCEVSFTLIELYAQIGGANMVDMAQARRSASSILLQNPWSIQHDGSSK